MTTLGPPNPAPVDVLVLGAGWLWHFLLPLLESQKLSYAATSRTGHTSNTIPWTLGGEDGVVVDVLPEATTVVITFPVLEWETLNGLIEAYERERGECMWIVLGSTRGWQAGGTGSGTDTVITRQTPLPPDPPARSVVEQRLLETYSKRATVLNLAGLHGVPSGESGSHASPRIVPNFLKRVAPSKEALRGKESLHLVHGADAALAIVLVHQRGKEAAGRWIVSDGLVRDWWAIGLELGGDEVKRWVLEIVQEEGIRVLPRTKLGRVVDGSEFWTSFGSWPRRVGMSV